MSILSEFSTECIGDRYCVCCQIHYPYEYMDKIDQNYLGVNTQMMTDRQAIFTITSRIMNLFAGLPLDSIKNNDIVRAMAKRIFPTEEVPVRIERDEHQCSFYFHIKGRTALTIELT